MTLKEARDLARKIFSVWKEGQGADAVFNSIGVRFVQSFIVWCLMKNVSYKIIFSSFDCFRIDVNAHDFAATIQGVKHRVYINQSNQNIVKRQVIDLMLKDFSLFGYSNKKAVKVSYPDVIKTFETLLNNKESAELLKVSHDTAELLQLTIQGLDGYANTRRAIKTDDPRYKSQPFLVRM